MATNLAEKEPTTAPSGPVPPKLITQECILEQDNGTG
jgi:hypothetical protein